MYRRTSLNSLMIRRKCYELVKNVKDILSEIPIHIYKNLIRCTFDKNEKLCKTTINQKTKI